MRIERIDDSTLKFYITYQDIESRGFDREELWMNKRRGEEFFWQLMDEVKDEHTVEFINEGPLWIQVQAFDKGLEVTVSKSQQHPESIGIQKGQLGLDHDEISNFLEETLQEEQTGEVDHTDLERVKRMLNKELGSHNLYRKPLIVEFDEFDDLIDYAYHQEQDETLYDDLFITYEGKYYFLIYFGKQISDEKREQTRVHLLEYANLTHTTEEVLMEYGKTLLSNNVRRMVRNKFAA